ncbi:MAG: hypothetical protein V8T87_04010 [Victivallales bacterium]
MWRLPARDIQAVADFAVEHQIDLVVVGPELPLCQGVADAVRAAGIPVFGPSQRCRPAGGQQGFLQEVHGQIRHSDRRLCQFYDKESALEYIRKEYDAGRGVVVKADGLAAGKGVIVAACRKDAEDAVEECFGGAFGTAGSVVVIEELLIGEEASILALADGKTVIPLVSSQDHKRLLDDDKGTQVRAEWALTPLPLSSRMR